MEKPTHYRRCHVCGHLNVRNSQPVANCSDCGKSLSPFYYFDDRFTMIMADSMMRPPQVAGEYGPIHGLTVYWENF